MPLLTYFFLALGWPWVGEFDGFITIFTCFPTQQNLVYIANTLLMYLAPDTKYAYFITLALYVTCFVFRTDVSFCCLVVCRCFLPGCRYLPMPPYYWLACVVHILPLLIPVYALSTVYGQLPRYARTPGPRGVRAQRVGPTRMKLFLIQ